uniref:Uncharacterized protein n=1 Tax=Anguilla anguilla TaxID=7936 RepID=A0A0E9PB55_ANGAN
MERGLLYRSQSVHKLFGK